MERSKGGGTAIVAPERIRNAILVIRGQRVMFDSDLAVIYGTTTKRLNEQVTRNAGRFPEDFVFRLTREESDRLRSQFATSRPGHGGRRHLPRVFTEHGADRAACRLPSSTALQRRSPALQVANPLPPGPACAELGEAGREGRVRAGEEVGCAPAFVPCAASTCRVPGQDRLSFPGIRGEWDSTSSGGRGAGGGGRRIERQPWRRSCGHSVNGRAKLKWQPLREDLVNVRVLPERFACEAPEWSECSGT
jgi:hypothetical protein